MYEALSLMLTFGAFVVTLLFSDRRK
ncbi:MULTISPECIES: putative holin-like toxin [Paenibacillus]|uniref:Holin-like toxin n=1 Tax=Paenibacillus medicaginis TaxID=1470560 RepID=A0ABV5C8P8_9BACL